jgi:hypothetical protein
MSYLSPYYIIVLGGTNMKKNQDYKNYPNWISMEVELLHETQYFSSTLVTFDSNVEMKI